MQRQKRKRTHPIGYYKEYQTDHQNCLYNCALTCHNLDNFSLILHSYSITSKNRETMLLGNSIHAYTVSYHMHNQLLAEIQLCESLNKNIEREKESRWE